MESKMKRCTKCLRDLPIESFHKNKTTNDGLEWWCKECKKKRSQDYRDQKNRGQKSEARSQKKRRSETKVRVSAKALPVVTRATPEQIIADLRRGLAIEIIDMIQEKFGL